MKIRLLIILCISVLNSYSQNSVRYKFIVEHPEVDTLTGAYFGMQFEFISQRVYISENQFAEKGLFVKDRSNKATIYFKRLDEKWYIKNFGSKWQLFYSNSKKKPMPTIKMNGKVFRIKWKKDETLFKKNVSVFVMRPVGFISNHQPDYFFDVHKGVIGIKAEDVMLVREDFK